MIDIMLWLHCHIMSEEMLLIYCSLRLFSDEECLIYFDFQASGQRRAIV